MGQVQGLMQGRRVLVTGAGSGIGEAVATKCSEEGARVAVLDVDEEAAAKVAGDVGGVPVVADVANSFEVERAVAAAAEALGGLDALCNNAGIGAVAALDRVSDDDWRRLISVNLTGVFNGMRAAVPHLRSAGGGSIVNVSSLSGLRPTRGEGPYSAAKAGVIALTSSAALEFGPDIRVNCVSPGIIATPLTAPLLRHADIRAGLERRIPLRRAGSPAEVANAVVWLASEQASYITGINVIVDGGSLLPSAQTDELLARYVQAEEQSNERAGPAGSGPQVNERR